MLGDHYKLLPIDLRDIQKLDDIIALADMDPRFSQFPFFLIKILLIWIACLVNSLSFLLKFYSVLYFGKFGQLMSPFKACVITYGLVLIMTSSSYVLLFSCVLYV